MFFTYNLACISGALEIASELDRNARLTVGEGREGGKGGREGGNLDKWETGGI